MRLTLSRHVRGTAAAATAFLALFPGVALAAATPDPARLRAALANPVESNFVEAEIGTQGTLEGPFDANSYADYYRSFGTSDVEIQQLLHYLKRDGFVGGYGREWFRGKTNDVLGELVMVFGGAAGASASEKATRLRYSSDSQFESFVDVALGQSSFAARLNTTYGYIFTVAVFVKGNDLFAVSRGSTTDYRTPDALAQARRAYDIAPTAIPVQGQTSPDSGAVAPVRLAVIVGLIVLLVIAAVVSTVLVLRPAGRAHPVVRR